MEIDEVHQMRQARLRKLLDDMTAKELSEKAGIAQSSISRMLKELGTDGAKNIGEKVARKIEASIGKPYGWLDSDNVVGMMAVQAGRPAHSDAYHRLRQRLSSMGGPVPLLNKDNAGMHKDYMDGTVTPPSTYQYHDDPTGLFAFTVPDDLMEPRIPKGCTAIINTTVQPQHGKLVLILDGETAYIRRLVLDGDLKFQETTSGRLPSRPLTGTIIGTVKEAVINLDDWA